MTKEKAKEIIDALQGWIDGKDVWYIDTYCLDGTPESIAKFDKWDVIKTDYTYSVKKESKDIVLKCEELKSFLLYKNKNYGNSALNPTKIFSKLDSNNSIKIRIDDKINRIMNSQELRENDIVDLAGYLVLLCVDMKIDFKKYME